MKHSFSTDDAGHRQALTILLADGEWKKQAEMIRAGGTSFSSRLKELRDAGQLIVTEKTGQGVYRYRLLGYASFKTKSKKPTRRQLEDVAEATKRFMREQPIPFVCGPNAKPAVKDVVEALKTAGFWP